MQIGYQYPKLWDDTVDENGANITTNQPSKHMPSHIPPASEASFAWARSVPRTALKITPQSCSTTSTTFQHRSFLQFLSLSFIIAQEFGLSTLLLAAHRCLICVSTAAADSDADYEEEIYEVFNEQDCVTCNDESKLSLCISIFAITLPMIAIGATAARWKQNRKGKKVRNKERIYYRTIDALLIAGMLRFLSSVLRTLTASYSSNTVMALAFGGMVLHLLSCDYGFANGIITLKSTLEDDNNASGKIGGADMTYEHGRPLFMGGTVAINCVFFSGVLLASRCPSDSISYSFLMVTVVLFANYPEARHTMAIAFRKDLNGKDYQD